MEEGREKVSLTVQTGAIILVVILFGALYYYAKDKTNQPTEQSQNTAQPVVEQSATTTKSSGTTKKSTPSFVKQSISYDQAINVYGSRRIQFDANCFVTPAFANYANGTKVMFDNRYEKGRWFYLDGKGYYLESYGFKIVTLFSNTLPHTVKLDCGFGKNNGQILLQ